jgi:hypothetical protein
MLFSRFCHQTPILDLPDFTSAIERLQETNFYVSAQLIQSLLERYGADG